MQRPPPEGVHDRKEGHIRPRFDGVVDLALLVIIESLSHFRVLFLHCLMHSPIEKHTDNNEKSLFLFLHCLMHSSIENMQTTRRTLN